MTAIRRLPLTVMPLPGESLVSLLTATAHRYGMPLIGLAEAMRLTAMTTATVALFFIQPYQQVAAIDEVLDRVATLLGRSDDEIRSMVPVRRARWPLQGRALHVYCPGCLSADDGRRLLSWTDPWTFTCKKHNTILEARCRACGSLPFPAPAHPTHRDCNRCSTCGASLAGPGTIVPAASIVHQLTVPNLDDSEQVARFDAVGDLYRHLTYRSRFPAMEPAAAAHDWDIAVTRAAASVSSLGERRYPNLSIHARVVALASCLDVISRQPDGDAIERFESCYPGALVSWATQARAQRHATSATTRHIARSFE